MKRPAPFLLSLAAATLLAACASGPSPAPQTPVVEAPPTPGVAARPQLRYALPAGRHHCELGRQVSLQRPAADPNRLDIEWAGKRYTMNRHPSHSGLPRYEDAASQLIWIELPWKGMLLDGRSGQPLANECRPA